MNTLPEHELGQVQGGGGDISKTCGRQGKPFIGRDISGPAKQLAPVVAAVAPVVAVVFPPAAPAAILTGEIAAGVVAGHQVHEATGGRR